MKKQYMKPRMEAVEIKINQPMLIGSPGSGVHTGDPQPPGGAMAPGLFEGEEWDAILGE